MVQDGGKKKKNKNKNKKKQQQQAQANDFEIVDVPQEVPIEPKQEQPPPTNNKPSKPNGLTNNGVKANNKDEIVLKSLAAEASQWMHYNWTSIQEAEAKYQAYLASNRKVQKKSSPAEKKEDSDDFDLFASDEEEKPKKATSKAEKKKQEQQLPKSRTASESEKKSKSRTVSESDKKSKNKKAEKTAKKEEVNTYLNVKNDEKTLVLLKPDAVHRNLMGEIICKFEERGFKMAAMKFVSASEDLLKNHYADLAKKPFFPELVRYMRSGPIVAMVWTGLNIVPMVRAMVGATRPMDAAPGSIRGDLCVDVGRNLIHASDSSESAKKEVAMWFPDQQIVQWRPCSLEWTYEDEVVEDKKIVDGIAAMAGGANADLVKKVGALEIENKSLKKATDDLKAMVAKLENRVAALEKKSGGAPAASAPAKKAAPAKEEEDDDDVDLFGSDDESEDDEEKNRVRDERLAAYHAKKAKKPAVIAKTSVVLDIKPWDDETDMDAMLKNVKTIQKEGLVWGASKLVPVGYGINKLRIMCVVEDEKVSIDELSEQIAEFEDFVQSVDIDSMQKI